VLFLFVLELKPAAEQKFSRTFTFCGAALVVSLLLVPAHELLEPLLRALCTQL
jgi:hypothetical protein